jgi:hypothetical protein
MAKLLLKSNEFTVETLVEHIKKQYSQKNNGTSFSKADIHDWANKQRIPKQYGGQYIRISKLGPLKLLTLSDVAYTDYSSLKVEIVNE